MAKANNARGTVTMCAAVVIGGKAAITNNATQCHDVIDTDRHRNQDVTITLTFSQVDPQLFQESSLGVMKVVVKLT
jgi:hypothetical protein